MFFCQAWEGVGVVASVRKLIGSTDPLKAEPGTIRGDLAVQTGRLGLHTLLIGCFMCSFSQNWFALSFLVLAIFLSYGELSAGMWFMAVTALKMESVK
jgi:hypothetical protein